jgi:uncharacterized protein (DUF2141 family)
MNTKKLFTALLFIPFWFISVSFTHFVMPQQLTIRIEGVRNDKGEILISVFNQKKGFPENKDLAYKRLRLPAKSGTVEFKIDQVIDGTYAFAVLHDENGNLEMDKNMFGWPKEGFCFSNQAKVVTGPPDFEVAAFQIKGGNKVVSSKVEYW